VWLKQTQVVELNGLTNPEKSSKAVTEILPVLISMEKFSGSLGLPNSASPKAILQGGGFRSLRTINVPAWFSTRQKLQEDASLPGLPGDSHTGRA
jgi:hypothetical protein